MEQKWNIYKNEFIQERRKDESIVKLINHIKKAGYSEEEKLSDEDVFSLYCKLLDTNRKALIKTLRLIEDLVGFSQEYSYQTINKQLAVDTISYPLLAYCILSEVDRKEIAYIQQHKKINHETGLKIEMQESSWNLQSVREKFDNDFVKPYKPYLILGDAYVNFIENCDNWNEKISATYAEFSQETTQYLGYMAEHFTYALQAEANAEAEDEPEAKIK